MRTQTSQNSQPKNIGQEGIHTHASGLGEVQRLPGVRKRAVSFSNHAKIQWLARNDAGRKITGILPVQAKLKIGRPNDRYEQEADRVADEIMRMEDNDKLYGKDSVKHSSSARSRAINGCSSNIKALKPELRQYFEPRFGYNFAHVRVHTDDAANESATHLNARAYTIGNNITFAAGEYQPETIEGKRLLAHELVHVIQQSDKNFLKTQFSSHYNSDDRLRIRNTTTSDRILRWTIIGNEIWTTVEGRELPVPIMTGTEEEWRQNLDRYRTRAKERLFLRALFVNDERFPHYAREDDNSYLLSPGVFITPPLSISRVLERSPNHNEKMALARAIILRRGQSYVWTYEQELLQRFIRAFQHRVIESEARAGRTFSRQQAGFIIPNVLSGPGGTSAPSAQQAINIGSGALSSASVQLLNGIIQYTMAYGSNPEELGVARTIIMSSGNILREIAVGLQQISDDERDNLESTIDDLVSIITIPGSRGLVTVAKNAFKEFVTPKIGSVFQSPIQHRNRTLLQDLIQFIHDTDTEGRTGTLSSCGFYEVAGHTGMGLQNLKRELVTLVTSLLQ